MIVLVVVRFDQLEWLPDGFLFGNEGSPMGKTFAAPELIPRLFYLNLFVCAGNMSSMSAEKK
jgi:hypothetical protein